ncbi:hypothetical protein J6590_031188 [Homalodisca vitripennis]|nr:hypothetical protein J6590_031188 [Homalodisca vitripennis]
MTSECAEGRRCSAHALVGPFESKVKTLRPVHTRLIFAADLPALINQRNVNAPPASKSTSTLVFIRALAALNMFNITSANEGGLGHVITSAGKSAHHQRRLNEKNVSVALSWRGIFR